jgi:hypothetical protein
METLYRNRLVAACRLCAATALPALCSKGAKDVAGDVEAGRMDKARVPCGGVRHRQRACFQGRWILGRGPDRWAFSDDFSLSVRMSFYCGSPQSLCAMKLHLASGSTAATGVFRPRRVQGPVCNFCFSRGPFCLYGWTAVLSILLRCTCICTGLVSLMSKYRYALSKKISNSM